MTFDFKKSTLFQALSRLTGMADSLDDKKEYTLEVKEKRQRRSKNANSYMWALCNLLAEKLSTPGNQYRKEDIYQRSIKAVGVYKDFENMKPSDAATLGYAWSRLGTGWVSEQVDYMPDGENVIIRCYYGSSSYNTKQMARLIDYIVQDCKAVGIETDEQERDRLIAQWEKMNCA